MGKVVNGEGERVKTKKSVSRAAWCTFSGEEREMGRSALSFSLLLTLFNVIYSVASFFFSYSLSLSLSPSLSGATFEEAGRFVRLVSRSSSSSSYWFVDLVACAVFAETRGRSRGCWILCFFSA